MSIPANPLRGGGIVTKDQGAGYEADLSHAAIADDAGHKVDSIRPSLLRVEAAADRQSFTAIFSEPVKSVVATLVITTNLGFTNRNIDSTVTINGNIATFDNPYPFVPTTSTYDGVDILAYDVADTNYGVSTYPFTTPATVPSTPQNFAALPGNGRVSLTWDAPESDGGRTIDSYEYRYREAVDPGETANAWGDWTEVPGSGPDGANRSHYRVMDLTNGQEYEFELHAVNGIGSSAEAGAAGTPREPGAIRATFAIDPASPVAEDAGTVTVTVTAATNTPAPPDAPVELTVGTADGTATAGEDYTALSQTVTFAVTTSRS